MPSMPTAPQLPVVMQLGSSPVSIKRSRSLSQGEGNQPKVRLPPSPPTGDTSNAPSISLSPNNPSVSLTTNVPGMRATVTPRLTILYNPGLKSAWFITTGMIGLLLVLQGSVVSSASLVREKEIGTVEQLLMTPAGSSEIIIA